MPKPAKSRTEQKPEPTTVMWEGGNTSALGRNGYMAQIGLIADRDQHNYFKVPVDKVRIEPINSLGRIGRCRLEIPTEKIPELIRLLSRLLEEAPLLHKEGTSKPCPTGK